jgi:hypothetical protein
MENEKKQRVLACPPSDFKWIEDFHDMEKLSEIYAKLECIADHFSTYSKPNQERPICASEIYGYWFIIRDICNELSDILKIDYWTGETGKKADEGGEE